MVLLMRGATRYHDWYDEHRTIPRRMLGQAQEAGMLGSVEWTSVSPDDERKEVADEEGILEQLLNHRPRRREPYRIAAGGSKPFPWSMTLGLFPYRKDLNQVEGYNILNLWFEEEQFPGPEGSDALVQAFRQLFTPDTTEFAFIHPYKRWSELSDTLDGPYGHPLTIQPMFSGVYWANFLGRTHLTFFDLARLKDLESYRVEWVDDGSLFVQVSDDIGDATETAVEEEMFRLTEIFRTALR